MTQTTIPHPGIRWRILAAAVTFALGVTVGVVAPHLGDGSAARVRADTRSTAVQAPPEGLSAYARSHGLTGLSPASLTRQESATATAAVAAIAETYRDVGRFAQAHGLAGLSPAGMARVTQRTTSAPAPPDSSGERLQRRD